MLVMLADLVQFILFPVQQKLSKTKFGEIPTVMGDQKWYLVRRLSLARTLINELPRNQLVRLVDLNLDYQYALKIGVHELLLLYLFRSDVFVAEFDEDLDKLARFLHSININSPLLNLCDNEFESLCSDEKLLLDAYYEKEREFASELIKKGTSLRNVEQRFLVIVSEVSSILLQY
jgi:hypothetical protein